MASIIFVFILLNHNIGTDFFYSVQKAAIPSLLDGRDVFVKSKTGTGTDMLEFFCLPSALNV